LIGRKIRLFDAEWRFVGGDNRQVDCYAVLPGMSQSFQARRCSPVLTAAALLRGGLRPAEIETRLGLRSLAACVKDPRCPARVEHRLAEDHPARC